MSTKDLNQPQYFSLISTLNNQYAWDYTDVELRDILHAIQAHTQETDTDTKIEKQIYYYVTENLYVKSLQHRDDPAYEQSWERCRDEMNALMHKNNYVSSNTTVEDIDDTLHEAFILISKALPTYHYHSKFTTWMFTIIARTVQNKYRFHNAEKRSAQVAYFTPDNEPVSEEGVEHQVQYNELLELITEILSEIDQDNAKIFFERCIEQKSLQELSDRYKCSTSTISRITHKALKELRDNPILIEWRNSA